MSKRIINNPKCSLENSNNICKSKERQKARDFISWYKYMVDNERQVLSLYLSEDVTLQWFGKTIKTRKKVGAFLKYDMQCSRHDFTTIECIDNILPRADRDERKFSNYSSGNPDDYLAKPLCSPETLKVNESSTNSRKRPNLRSCNSPEWDVNYKPQDDSDSKRKRKKINDSSTSEMVENESKNMFVINKLNDDSHSDIANKGDGFLMKRKLKCAQMTPPGKEVGQGDCMPSTSDGCLNTQYTKNAVECNGFIEFTRSKNQSRADSMKWERKCKVQIIYSEDPLNKGEYIIWQIQYTDESKCRRNLLAAFEEASLETSD